jgi:hypothetical protein
MLLEKAPSKFSLNQLSKLGNFRYEPLLHRATSEILRLNLDLNRGVVQISFLAAATEETREPNPSDVGEQAPPPRAVDGGCRCLFSLAGQWLELV